LRQLEGMPPTAERPPPGFADTLHPSPAYVPEDWQPKHLPVLEGYEVLSELGRGGMGVVYQAWQIRLKRMVALKMISAGPLAGEVERKRFLIEIEAAARLRHPHIVPIYEVGELEGRPYFSMEYAEGGTLARRLAGTPVPARQAAQILELLARAMDYAHSRGIIHRDLTPANVLLQRDFTAGRRQGEERRQGDGETRRQGEQAADSVSLSPGLRVSLSSLTPKISDFGLAKIVIDGGATQTRTGAVLGTPSYMSPEQATGKSHEIGPATDIYALGAILYELLTGRPPFRAATSLDTVLQVAAEEPVPPTRLQPRIPGDIETICLKCLQKEPRSRYESALALAEDLERFQQGQPILARPISSAERLVRWGRRNPTIAALAGAVGLLLILAAIGSSVAALWLKRERDDAVAAREDAVQNLARGRKLVEDYCTNVAQDQRLKQQDLYALRKKLLEAAVPFYDEIVRQKADDGPLLSDQGRAHRRLAFLRYELGEHQRALAEYAKAIDLHERLAAEHPSVAAYRSELASSRNNLGELLRHLGRREEARAEYTQAIDLHERLAAEHPSVAEYRSELARTRNDLGILLNDLGRREEARAEIAQAIDLRERLAAEHPSVAEYRVGLASSATTLGVVLIALGRWEEARAEYAKAIDLHERLAVERPAVPEGRFLLAISRNNLGALLNALGRRDEARAEYTKASELRERLVAEHPFVPAYRVNLAGSRNNLGELLRKLGRWEEAGEEYRKALSLLERLAADFPAVPEYAETLAVTNGNYGHLMRDSGRLGESLAWFDKSLSGFRSLLAKEPQLAFARYCMREFGAGKALALARLGQYAEASDLVGTLANDKELSDDALYYTAASLALCSAGNGSDAGQRGRRAEKAVALLRRAQAGGYFKDPAKPRQLKTSKDFDPLHQRDDFRKLLADLGKKQ
jgi:eukaryotic-like serine/threonine-protein kinase